MKTVIEDGSDTQPARAREGVGDDMVTGSVWKASTQSTAMGAVWLLAAFCLMTNLITALVNGSAAVSDFITVAFWVALGAVLARGIVFPREHWRQ